MAEAATDESAKCPHCGERIGVGLIASAKAESRMVYKIGPPPGELLSAKNLGAVIKTFGDLMISLGRDLGIPTEVLVERVETNDTGEIAIHVLLARWKDHHHSAINRAARRRADAHATPRGG